MSNFRRTRPKALPRPRGRCCEWCYPAIFPCSAKSAKPSDRRRAIGAVQESREARLMRMAADRMLDDMFGVHR